MNIGYERQRTWISTQSPGFGYWLLDRDGLGLDFRVRMDMELAKALVTGIGIRHQLGAVKNDALG